MLRSGEVNSEQIEDILSMFSEMGVNVVETEEAEPEEEGTREEPEEEPETENELVEVRQKVPAKAGTKEPIERTDDPVRMYLREMGTMELLSREGEIAIAKRIEAGREAMIAGLCESPLTFQAVIIWREELNEGKVFLRDIIDLEATYAGPDAKAMPAAVVIGPDGQPVVPVPGAPIVGAQPPQIAGDRAGRCYARSSRPAIVPKARKRPPRVRPAKATSTTTTIWKIGSRSRRSRPSSSPRCLRPSTPSPAHSRDCAACRTRTSSSSSRACRSLRRRSANTRSSRRRSSREVKSLRLHQTRIDALVEQLYEINKRLVGYEGRLMRLAESHGVSREDFLKNYQGSELDPLWLNRVSKLSAKGWKNSRRQGQGQDQAASPRDPGARGRDRARDRRVPQDRAHGAEG